MEVQFLQNGLLFLKLNSKIQNEAPFLVNSMQKQK